MAALPAWAATPLQPLIDATPAGGHLTLAPGEYAGPAVITQPLHLDGGGKATLRGDGQSTVLTLRASASSVRGLDTASEGPTLISRTALHPSSRHWMHSWHT